jgi:hypothetical protein
MYDSDFVRRQNFQNGWKNIWDDNWISSNFFKLPTFLQTAEIRKLQMN